MFILPENILDYYDNAISPHSNADVPVFLHGRTHHWFIPDMFPSDMYNIITLHFSQEGSMSPIPFCQSQLHTVGVLQLGDC